MYYKHINLPLVLTLIRLIFSPLILPIILVLLLPYNYSNLNWILAGIYIVFSLTDFFDGYLARKYKQETMLGKILDPIADKVMFYAALIALLTVGKIFFYWVVIFIGREFFIMGLRIVAIEHGFIVPVNKLGKLKTIAQTAYVTAAIANPYHGLWRISFNWNMLETLLLILALFLSIGSFYNYYISFIKQYQMRYLP